MNLRNVIKSAILDILKTPVGGNYPTLAGEKVYKNRGAMLLDDNGVPALPAICIYIMSDTVEERDNETNKVTSSLTIECIADGDDSDDIVDAMSNQVEYLIAQNQDLDNSVSSIDYKGGNRGSDEEHNSDIVAWIMNYEVVYQTPSTADASLLSNLERIDADYGNETVDTIIY